MANPVIREIRVTPSVIPPGGTAVVEILAIDGDARVITLTGTTEDSGGGQVTLTASLTVADPLTHNLAADDLTVQITRDPQEPNKFHLLAPVLA